VQKEERKRIEEKNERPITGSPAIERLDQLEFCEQQNPEESGENLESIGDIVLTHALVFRCDLRTFVRVRRCLLDLNGFLIYETRSVADKLIVQHVPCNARCMDCIAWAGHCVIGHRGATASTNACQEFHKRVTGYEKVRETP
jgi:hypothetical protein